MNYTYSLRNPYLYEYSLGSLEVYSFGYYQMRTASLFGLKGELADVVLISRFALRVV